MLPCRLINLSVSLILTTVVSNSLCRPQNDFRHTKSIQVPHNNNVNNRFSFLGIKLQTLTSFPVPRVFSIFDTNTKNIPVYEKPVTPYPDIKPKIKFVETNNNVDVSQTNCVGDFYLDCAKKKELDEEIYNVFIKDAASPKTDKESDHKSITESSKYFSSDSGTDISFENTTDYITETNDYASTTTMDEDLLNRMAVPSQVVASLLG